MATDKATIEMILDQLTSLPVRTRAMFGEYALYCDGKVVAFICDDTVFMKPTAVSNDFLDDDTLAPPYPGAKNYYAIPGDRLEEREWFQDFVQRTADALPVPKEKAPRKKRS